MEAVRIQEPPDLPGAPPPAPLLPIVERPAHRDEEPLIARLLQEQRQLTAVEQFAHEHENGGLPAQAAYYARLLPANPPSIGQQYAFEVDLDRCSGCKACVSACHALNGLDEQETWRDVGMLVGGTSAQPVMQHVTTACHHCIEPACMIACPVDAYEKDPATGIVRHLDDQCFGCQYCTLACPYDVPKYHAQKGIVRKCDMCADRLAVGEAPACVQACPHEAISIRVVDVDQVIENAEADNFLPAAPEPHITLPTTTYRTDRVFPRNMLPADYYAVNPQHPHWPLIIMLVLTQLSVGAFAVGVIVESLLNPESAAAIRPVHAGTALLFGLLALSASLLHLGRPQYAWRAIIGLRHSWLSREILTFGLFAGLATLFAAAVSFGPATLPPVVTDVLGWSVVAAGAAGVFCSVMIYVATRREFWSLPATGAKFVLTSAVLGISATLLTLALLTAVRPGAGIADLTRTLLPPLSRALIAVATVKLLFEASFFRHLLDRRTTALKRSALLMAGPLSNQTLARFACGFLGGIAAPLLLMSHLQERSADAVVLWLAFALQFAACLSGELLERYLFFAAVATPRMPGAIRT